MGMFYLSVPSRCALSRNGQLWNYCFVDSGSEEGLEEGKYQCLWEWILLNDPCSPGAYFPWLMGRSLLRLCWRVRSAWSVVSKHQRFITKTNLWGCLISAMVRGRGEAYRDTLWCWRFYLQKEFIACFLSLPLIVLVCESMTRRLAEG